MFISYCYFLVCVCGGGVRWGRQGSFIMPRQIFMERGFNAISFRRNSSPPQKRKRWRPNMGCIVFHFLLMKKKDIVQ